MNTIGSVIDIIQCEIKRILSEKRVTFDFIFTNKAIVTVKNIAINSITYCYIAFADDSIIIYNNRKEFIVYYNDPKLFTITLKSIGKLLNVRL